MGILDIGLIVLICIILASITYVRGLLDLSGSVTAFIVGIIIGLQGGILWIFLLLIFLASSFLATRYKFNYKKKIDAQEGKKGERGVTNVLANGLVPMILAVLHTSNNSSNILTVGIIPHNIVVFLFITSIAGAAADTLASEMGILSRKTYLITSGEKVKPGTNGGISFRGELWAFVGSLYTFIVAFAVFGIFESYFIPLRWIIIGNVMGFISCQIDSLLGATLERKDIIGKSTVNLFAITISIIITGVIIWIIKFW